MMQKLTVIARGKTVELKLTPTERAAIVDNLPHLDEAFREAIRAAEGKPIPFTLADLDELSATLWEAFEECDSVKLKKKFRSARNKAERLLGTFTDIQDEDVFSFFSSIADQKMSTRLPEMLQADDESISPEGYRQLYVGVQLTKAQRDALLSMDTIPGDVHKLIDVDAKGERTFELSPRQIVVVSLGIVEAIGLSPPSKHTRILENILQRIEAAAPDTPDDVEVIGPTRVPREGLNVPAAGFRLKITLDHTQPPIWRSIETPDCTLDWVHEMIQVAMGWENAHLHAFQVGEQYLGPPEMDDAENEETVTLGELFASGVKKFRYWYDFGDDWWHTIQFEKPLDEVERNPRLIAGERACPPEDVGGVGGYYEMVEALRNPRHESYQEFREWIGDYDANKFDLARVNRQFGEWS